LNKVGQIIETRSSLNTITHNYLFVLSISFDH